MYVKSLCQGIYHILFDMDSWQIGIVSSLCLYSVCVRVRVSVCVIFLLLARYVPNVAERSV